MTCECGDDLSKHGRKGFGACRAKDWTEHGRKEANRIAGECKAEGKAPVVILRVLETLFALPGMHRQCGCKRFRKYKPGALTCGGCQATMASHDRGNLCAKCGPACEVKP